MSSRPRILVFSLAYFPLIGGAEVALQELIKRLPEFEFELVSAPLNRRGRLSWWNKYFFPISGYREAVRRQQKNPYQLVWAMMANQAGMAAALFKKRFPAIPLLLTLQEGDDFTSWRYRLRLLGPRFLGVFKRANAIQAISGYLAAWARQMGAVCPVTVIPNGVDLTRFKLHPPPFSLSSHPTIITTSRLVAKNGVEDLIESLTHLPDQVRLLIVGSGPLESLLKLQASRSKLQARVEFAGAVPPAQIPDHLARAAIFARPSLSEGQGISFLEAMAAGLPVIATPVGGIPDFLKAGETGWFCEPRNPASLAAQVKFILDPANQAVVAKITQTARALVHKEYDWATLANKMGMLFNEVIS